jgi:hypothetical protein
MKIRSPLVWALLAGLAVVVAAFVPVFMHMEDAVPGASPTGLSDAPPWQIDIGERGAIRAFGLQLPGSSLADARDRWGDRLQVALIESRSQPLALEAYVEHWSGGGVDGKLALAFAVSNARLMRWRDQAPRGELIDAQARRWPLSADDLADALQAPVSGLSFVPHSRIDIQTLQARFGSPDERLHGPTPGLQHGLYADRGLSISWDAETQRTVIQVVARADFDRLLRQPLLAAAQTRPAASSAAPTAPASGSGRSP